ncbi:MAG TPA: putative glycoside hydrolase, partial [Polyangia bacterium]
MAKRLSSETQPYTPKGYADHGLADTMTEQGRHARGFYITPMYLRGLGALRTAAAMKRGKLDAVVIDMKDDLGHLTYPSKIPLGQKQVNVLIKDPAAMVKTFHEQGIYVIARIVSFKDSRLPYVRPDLAVRIGAHAERLYAVGENWLDAYSPEVQDYLIDIALELKSFGVDEIQFDYMRFPRGLPSSYATWLHAGKKPPSHADVIA